MAGRVEVDELLSRAILVYLGMEEKLTSLPRNSRSRLDAVFGAELAADLWERMLPYTRSFGKDKPIVNDEDRKEMMDRAKEKFREFQPGLSAEESDNLFVESNQDPNRYIARDRSSQVAGENARAVSRALAESRQRFPEISDTAHEAMSLTYGYTLVKEGYGRV